jgi:hypothetical protein
MLMFGEVVEMALSGAAYDEMDEDDEVEDVNDFIREGNEVINAKVKHVVKSEDAEEDNDDDNDEEDSLKYFGGKQVPSARADKSTDSDPVVMMHSGGGSQDSIPLTTATNEVPSKPRRFRRRLLVPEKMVIEAKVRRGCYMFSF